MGLAAAFRRLRHGRGFGIHSPFAFRFVTEVLNQRCAYYAYLDVPDEIMSVHDWRLLVRVLNHFHPGNVALGPGVPPKVGRFIRRVLPKAVFTGTPEVLVAFSRLPEDLEERVRQGDLHAVVLNSKSMPDPAQRAHGMVFGNGKSWIMAAYSHLPAQNFDVRF